MSMNLYLTVDGEGFELYQTPTYITYMCLTDDASVAKSATGKKACAAIARYLIWVRTQGHCSEHIERLRFALKDAKKIKAYML